MKITGSSTVLYLDKKRDVWQVIPLKNVECCMLQLLSFCVFACTLVMHLYVCKKETLLHNILGQLANVSLRNTTVQPTLLSFLYKCPSVLTGLHIVKELNS